MRGGIFRGFTPTQLRPKSNGCDLGPQFVYLESFSAYVLKIGASTLFYIALPVSIDKGQAPTEYPGDLMGPTR
ncbi:hypothetical protein SALBM135S_00747 [Streptomyces alboniger]